MPYLFSRWHTYSSPRGHLRFVGAAACMAVCLTHPIDQTKIRTQTLPPNLRQNVLQTALTSVQHGGVKGLWTGLSASLLRQCTYGAARFGIYGWLKDRGSRVKGGHQVPLWVNGAVAGVAAGVVGAPAGKSSMSFHPYLASEPLNRFMSPQPLSQL